MDPTPLCRHHILLTKLLDPDCFGAEQALQIGLQQVIPLDFQCSAPHGEIIFADAQVNHELIVTVMLADDCQHTLHLVDSGIGIGGVAGERDVHLQRARLWAEQFDRVEDSLAYEL